MMKNDQEIREHLISSDPEFRRMSEEHQQFEGKLQALSLRHRLSEQDHLEEITLKKKKLHLKDQMNSVIQKVRSELSHQHS